MFIVFISEKPKEIRHYFKLLLWMEMNAVQSQKPIGVFDSGVGGLSVVKEILKKLPEERIVYFGDTANVPYGSKSAQELIQFGDKITEFLISQDAKMIIIACNTSSSLSFDFLKEKYDLPFIDVIKPSIDVAINSSKKQKIGVIATEATIKTGVHKKLLLEANPEAKVYTCSCPKFVPLVEQGIVEGIKVEEAVAEYLIPLREQGIDVLILGCTHYPFLQKSIQKILGEEIKIIDPAQETVIETQEKLQQLKLMNRDPKNDNKYFSSGDSLSFQENAQKFIQNEIKKVSKVDLVEQAKVISKSGEMI